MVATQSQKTLYQTTFSNGTHTGISDATRQKDGQQSGFRPHELLEAALASCMNITLRMEAEDKGIPLVGCSVIVRLDRTIPGKTIFEYEVLLQGQLNDGETGLLLEALEKCPVRTTLSKGLSFRRTFR